MCMMVVECAGKGIIFVFLPTDFGQGLVDAEVSFRGPRARPEVAWAAEDPCSAWF